MNKQFFNKLWISEEELLQTIRDERTSWEDFCYDFKLWIEADIKLLKNQRDKKKDEKLVWDSTLFNVHSALVARSYKATNSIKLRWDKNWVERDIKMLNACLDEDNNSANEKGLRYYMYDDKFATWVSIKARIGWDWVYKRNITAIVNPLTWIPDPNWDYFLWNYKFTGFFAIKSKAQLKEEWHDIDDLLRTYTEWAIDKKERLQRQIGLTPEILTGTTDLVDVYFHFTYINGKRIYAKTASLDSVLLDAGFIKPNNQLEEKNPEAIKPPFAFYYWKPDRNNPFWDRPANYTRDVQLQKAEIANLRLNKMRAELYPMYLYNSDLISGKDLSFGFNKGIPVKMGMWWEQFNIGNVMTPIQKDLRVDTSFQVEQSLDRQVEKSTSIWEVVQGTTPTKRETLGTNNLIQTNTDVNLELNEEIHSVWDEQWINLWFGWYYQNFASGDKKLVFAGSTTAKTAIILKRKDLIYDGNLSISIEWSIAREDRIRKELAASVQVTPLIMPDLNPASKIQWQRYVSERAWVPMETMDEILLDTPQMMLQKMENEALKEDVFVPIEETDDHIQHLVAIGTTINTAACEAHKLAHIMEIVKQWQQVPEQDGLNENAMQNSMMSQAIGQAGSQLQNA